MQTTHVGERSGGSLATVFHASLYLVVGLASLPEAFVEQSLFPTVLTIPLAIAAFFLNERLGLVRLSAGWGTLLGAIALVVSGMDFFAGDTLGRLLALAHLLTYLTWIMMFMDKSGADHTAEGGRLTDSSAGRASTYYWFLLALSMLQLAAGSVQTSSGWFGVVLIPWMMLLLWTVSVFLLYQGQLRFAGQDQHGVALGAIRGRSVLRNAVQLDPQERWLSLRFTLGNIGMSLVGLFLGMGMFLFVPRQDIGGFELFSGSSNPLKSRALTGFGDNVRLGDIGSILENRQRVLRVSLTSSETNRKLDLEAWVRQVTPADLPAPVLFRGSVFDRYEREFNGQGSWTREPRGQNLSSLSNGTPGQFFVKQEITLEPIGTDVAFAMWPWAGGRLKEGIDDMARNRSRVLFFKQAPASVIRYTIYSPTQPPVRSDHNNSRLYLELPEGLPNLRRLAAELTQPDKLPSNLPGGTDTPLDRRKALALDAYLRTSGTFSYTLTDTVIDRSIDPVEDFLFNRKKGHCQYFATALALMLRSVGIPARLINGFKGVEPSDVPGEYIVEQRHAHAWVEAYINGSWLTLDPTVDARDESVAEIGRNNSPWSAIQSDMSSFWSSYVDGPGLTKDSQQKNLFGPLAGMAINLWNSVTGGEGKIGLPHWLWLLFTSPELWFTPDGAVSAVAILAILWGGYFGLRKLVKVVRGRAGPGRGRRQIVRVDFYERFLKLTARRGLQKAPGQTPREFGQLAGRTLFDLLQPADLHTFPLQLADQFYRVRFGDEAISPDETKTLNGQLDRYEQCLRAK